MATTEPRREAQRIDAAETPRGGGERVRIHEGAPSGERDTAFSNSSRHIGNGTDHEGAPGKPHVTNESQTRRAGCTPPKKD
jgi:hypothetical protein